MRRAITKAYHCVAILIFGYLYLNGQAIAGENILYPGMASKPDPLRPGSQALFPASPSGNTVQVNGAFTGRVYGALVQGNGSVSANSVDITADVVGNVHGGYVRGNGNAFGNTVRIGSGVIVDTSAESTEFQGITGGHTFGNFQAFDNIVDINGQVQGPSGDGGVVAGGYSRGNNNVVDNTVIIRPGALVGSPGSRVSVYGGYNLSDSGSPSGAITGNTVIMYGGTVTGDIYGGHSDNSSSDNNTIYFGGGTINGKVIGGHLDTGGGSASNNRITIVGGTGLDLSGAFLYGNTPTATSWRTDGNALIVDRFKQSTNGNVFDLANFQYYDFIMSESMMNGDVFLNITNTGFPGTVYTDIDNASIDVHVLGGAVPMQPGDSVYLFKTNGNDLLTGTPSSVTVAQGVSLKQMWK